MIRKTLEAFYDDECMLLSAALAFYTALSFAPALILLIWGSSLLGTATQEQIVAQISATAGGGAGDVAAVVLKNAGERPEIGTIAGTIALLILLFASTTLFAQVQAAMNMVWNVQPRPDAGLLKDLLKGLLRKRLSSFLMLLFVMLLVLVAVLVSTVFMYLIGQPEAADDAGFLWGLLNGIISVVVFALAVAAIFKFLPDVIIEWRAVWVGASITGALLVVGKFLTGLYLSRGALGSAYGAGGALFVLLLWVYYSWAIVLLGAEFTQIWAHERNLKIQPDARAVPASNP